MTMHIRQTSIFLSLEAHPILRFTPSWLQPRMVLESTWVSDRQILIICNHVSTMPIHQYLTYDLLCYLERFQRFWDIIYSQPLRIHRYIALRIVSGTFEMNKDRDICPKEIRILKQFLNLSSVWEVEYVEGRHGHNKHNF